jgi:hydroxymethylbilane synthase
MADIPRIVRIATRESLLAMTQTNMVADALRARHPGLAVELVGMTTKGDRILDRPLSQVGGKGLFVKELELALEEDRADVAVHSLKDVPMELPWPFTLATFGEREAPLDAFVSRNFDSLAALPAGARVGTSSLRRECQLRRARPDLTFHALRGNVGTRLAKLDAGQYDAVILAVAGLKRLGLGARVRATIPATLSLPAITQGILGIEYLRGRDDVAALFAPLEHRATRLAADAERALGRVVEGSCEVPVGAYATLAGDVLTLEGFIGTPDGEQHVRDRVSGPSSEAERLGETLGERLLAAGGRAILDRIAQTHA